MLLVRLLVNRRLRVVKFFGESKVTYRFLSEQGSAPQSPHCSSFNCTQLDMNKNLFHWYPNKKKNTTFQGRQFYRTSDLFFFIC